MNDMAVEILLALGRTTLCLAAAGAIAWSLLRVGRVDSPTVHRVAWILVLLVGWSFARLSVGVPWYDAPSPPRMSSVEPSQSIAPPTVEPPVLASSFPLDMATPELPPASTPELPLEIGNQPPSVRAQPIATQSGIAGELVWPLAIVFGWAAGMVGLLALHLLGYARFVRQLPKEEAEQQGDAMWHAEWRTLLGVNKVQRAIPLRVTAEQGPMLCYVTSGYVLFVPIDLWRELDAAGRQAILRHELAHYLRGDVWKSLAARVLALPHWFNPVAWLAVRRFEEAAEWACDRAATSNAPATEYAKALVRLGEMAGHASWYGSTAGGRTLAARIRRLLFTRAEEDSTMKITLLIATALCLAAAPLVRVQLVAKEPAPAENLVAQALDPESPTDRAASEQDSTEKASGPTYLNSLPEESPAGQKPDTPKANGIQVYFVPDAPTSSAPPPAAAPQNAARDKAAKKMVAEASKAYEATYKAYEAENLTLESVYNWSRRWMSAAMDATSNRLEKMKAVEEHLSRMQNLHARVKTLYDIGTKGGEAEKLAALDFFIAEAERMQVELAAAEVAAQHLQAARKAGTAPATRPAGAEPVIADPVADGLRWLQAASRSGGANRDPNLLYDGHNFQHWQSILKTDLSLEKRTEAVRAMGAFGANGYGPEATKAVFAVMRGYLVWQLDETLEGKFKKAALTAVAKIPPSERLQALTEALQSGNVPQRLFAVYVLAGDVAEPKDALPLLAKATNDDDPQVRLIARSGIAMLDRETTTLVPILRAALARPDSRDVNGAVYIITGQVGSLPTLDRNLIPAEVRQRVITVLIPDVVKLLGHANESVRRTAAGGLRNVGVTAEADLKQAADSNDAKVAARARIMLDVIENSRRLPASAYSDAPPTPESSETTPQPPGS